MGKAYLGCKATAGLCQPLIGIMPPYDMSVDTHLGRWRHLQAQGPGDPEHRH